MLTYTKQNIIYLLSILPRFYECEELLKNTEKIIEKVDIEQALEKLTEKERQVLILYYTYNYNYYEISRKTGIKQGSINYYKNRALSKLCEFLNERGSLNVE